MNPDSLVDTWAGTAHNSNDWDMEITISITEPVQVGEIQTVEVGEDDMPTQMLLGHGDSCLPSDG